MAERGAPPHATPRGPLAGAALCEQPQAPNYGKPLYTPAAPPQKGAGLTPGETLRMLFCMLLPIAGLVLMFIWAFGPRTKKPKRQLAQALLIFMLVCACLLLLLAPVLLPQILSAFYELYYGWEYESLPEDWDTEEWSSPYEWYDHPAIWNEYGADTITAPQKQLRIQWRNDV